MIPGEPDRQAQRRYLKHSTPLKDRDLETMLSRLDRRGEAQALPSYGYQMYQKA